MKGVKHYQSASGFEVIRLHYSADPAKDPATEQGNVWIQNEVKGIPGGFRSSQWRQEMEIDWDATGGELCFPQLEMYEEKIVVNPFEVPESWSLYGSFDYGHRNPASFHVYAIDYDGDMYAVWEYYKAGKGYRYIAESIRGCPYFDRLSFMPIADPSIWAKTQQSADTSEVKSIAQLFYELPDKLQIMFAPGKSGGDIAVAEKINSALWNDEKLKAGEAPRLRIFKTCPMLVWEMKKLRYADWSGSMQEQRNLKESIVDKDNHAFDDLKMFMTMFFMSPDRPKEDPLENLKKIDRASYDEWKRVEQLHNRSTSTRGSMGEF